MRKTLYGHLLDLTVPGSFFELVMGLTILWAFFVSVFAGLEAVGLIEDAPPRCCACCCAGGDG